MFKMNIISQQTNTENTLLHPSTHGPFNLHPSSCLQPELAFHHVIQAKQDVFSNGPLGLDDGGDAGVE